MGRVASLDPRILSSLLSAAFSDMDGPVGEWDDRDGDVGSLGQ